MVKPQTRQEAEGKPLTDLNPKWIGCLRTPDHGEGMTFECPACGPSHTLAVYFSDPVDGHPGATWHSAYWHREGDSFETLTLAPSIQYPCWHGWIESGEVIDISESPAKTMIQDGQGRVSGPIALSPRQYVRLQTTGKLG